MKVGIIGTGFGARVVAPAFAKARGVTVVEVVTPHDGDAVKRLCERPDVDLVSIHSPPFLHREHVELATSAGKAVLCDKPFGSSAADSQACLEAAQRAGVLHFLNVEFRCAPVREKLRELVKAGAIGRVEHLVWSLHLVGARVPMRRYGWLFDASRGGGWIGAWAPHAVDFLQWAVGDVGRVGGTRRLIIAERVDREGRTQRCTAEDGLAATLEVGSGATAVFDSTNCARVALPMQIVVLGSDGALVAEDDRRLTLLREGKTEIVARAEFSGDLHNLPMQIYAERIRDAFSARSAGTLPTFADGVAIGRVLERLRALPLAHA